MQFVTEKEVEDIKVKKQKEWEKVRKPDQPLERPEEEHDGRTLYERLKVQRDQKHEEHAEQFKFKNMIYKGLDDEEATFLQFVAEKKAQLDTEQKQAENEEILAFRDAVEKMKEEADSVKPLPSSSSSSSSSSLPTEAASSAASSGKVAAPTCPASSSLPAKTHKSQLSLIAGSIKTKRKRRSTDNSEEKLSPEKKQKLSSSDSTSTETAPPHPSAQPAVTTSTASTLSALSGLAAYSSSDSDDSSHD